MKKEKIENSIEILIEYSYQVELFINPDALSLEEFKINFKNDIKNKKYIDSKYQRKKLIKKLKDELEAIKMFKEFADTKKSQGLDDNDFRLLKDFLIREIILDQQPRGIYHYLFIGMRIILTFLCALAGFGLFSYNLNILYAPFEVFIYAVGILLLLILIDFIKTLSFVPSNAKSPYLVLSLGLMTLNIFFKVFNYCYIWFLYVLFVVITTEILCYLFKKMMRR